MTESPGMIRGTVADLLASGRKRIVLDLANVTYLDSAAGIGELVSSYTSALRQGAQLRLLRAGKNVDRVLRIVGLHNVFEIYDDEASALNSFAESSLATGIDA
jgi:anti-sigma B factor antagonist